jgi:hypothetical protein
MIPDREAVPIEQAALLNRSFCGILLWSAASGYAEECGTRSDVSETGLPFELAFLILPLVLPRPCRAELPKRVDKSLGVWLLEHPLIVAQFASRANGLARFTRSAMAFAASYGLLQCKTGTIYPDAKSGADVAKSTKRCSAEVRECIKKAHLVGRWFSRSGSSTTILTLLGVRP